MMGLLRKKYAIAIFSMLFVGHLCNDVDFALPSQKSSDRLLLHIFGV
jgi:hypothetical protein